MAHVRQSTPDSGRGVQVQVLKIFQTVPFSLGSGVCGECVHPQEAPIRIDAFPFGADGPSLQTNMAHIRQSRPEYGLGLSHFQYERGDLFAPQVLLGGQKGRFPLPSEEGKP